MVRFALGVWEKMADDELTRSRMREVSESSEYEENASLNVTECVSLRLLS